MLVFGTICIDRIRRVPHLPEVGGYVEVTEESFLLGGEAINTANALHVWGAPVKFCGNALGSGPEGDLLRKLLAEKGIANIDVVKPGRSFPTAVCDIYVPPDGERTMFGIGFSAMEASVDIERLPLFPGEWFTVDSNMPIAFNEAIRRADAAGMKIYVMDLGDVELKPGWFWQGGAGGEERGNKAAKLRWVSERVDRYGCFTILTDGGEGFVAGSPEHPVRAYPPFPVTGIVDATGGGDVFRAGMLFGLEQGWEIGRCLAFASAAGGLNGRSVGAATNVPTVEEIEAFLAEHRSICDQYF